MKTEFTYTTDIYGIIHQEPPTITAKYDKKYMEERYQSYGIKPAGMAALRLGHILQYASLPPGSDVCDIGYGNGEFLEACKRYGLRTYGIDVSDVEPPLGTRRVDHSCLTWTWDLLTFFDSLEHFESDHFLTDLHARYVCVTAPYCHWEQNDPEFLKWKHRRPGEHIHHFNPGSLSNILGGLYELQNVSNVEDAIRGTLNLGLSNTFTAIFKRR